MHDAKKEKKKTPITAQRGFYSQVDVHDASDEYIAISPVIFVRPKVKAKQNKTKIATTLATLIFSPILSENSKHSRATFFQPDEKIPEHGGSSSEWTDCAIRRAIAYLARRSRAGKERESREIRPRAFPRVIHRALRALTRADTPSCKNAISRARRKHARTFRARETPRVVFQTRPKRLERKTPVSRD